MHLLRVLSAALAASCVSAGVARGHTNNTSSQKIYATLYQKTNYRGGRGHMDVTKLLKCAEVRALLRGETYSLKFKESDISCNLYNDDHCTEVLYEDLVEDQPDMRKIDAHYKLNSLICRQK